MPVIIRMSAEAKMPGQYDFLRIEPRTDIPKGKPTILVSADKITVQRIEASFEHDQALINELTVAAHMLYDVDFTTHRARMLSYVIED